MKTFVLSVLILALSVSCFFSVKAESSVAALDARIDAIESLLDASIENGIATSNVVLPDSSLRCTRNGILYSMAVHSKIASYPLQTIKISTDRYLAPLFTFPGNFFCNSGTGPDYKAFIGRLIVRYSSNTSPSVALYGDVPIEAYFDGENTQLCINFHSTNLSTQTIAFAYGVMVYMRP